MTKTIYISLAPEYNFPYSKHSRSLYKKNRLIAFEVIIDI
jgi:hypothetical protein